MKNLFAFEAPKVLNNGADTLEFENKIRDMLRGLTVAEAIHVLNAVLSGIEHCGIIPLDDNEFMLFRKHHQNSASSSFVG
jgi:hypothetical protein